MTDLTHAELRAAIKELQDAKILLTQSDYFSISENYENYKQAEIKVNLAINLLSHKLNKDVSVGPLGQIEIKDRGN